MSNKIKISESELRSLVRDIVLDEAHQMDAFGGSPSLDVSKIETADKFLVNLKGMAGSGSYELRTEDIQDVIRFLRRERNPDEYSVTVYEGRSILDQISGDKFLMKLKRKHEQSLSEDDVRDYPRFVQEATRIVDKPVVDIQEQKPGQYHIQFEDSEGEGIKVGELERRGIRVREVGNYGAGVIYVVISD